MPTEYFGKDFPWSISMGYAVSDSVEVELIRLTDNKTWKFSKSSADGYFNVDNGGYGEQGCIIFRPDGIERYVAGEKFKVNITGLSTPLSYEVSFFDLVPITGLSLDKTSSIIRLGKNLDLGIKFLPESAKKIVRVTVDGKILRLGKGKNSGIYDYDADNGFDIKADKYGTTTISVSTYDGRITKSKKITVIPSDVYIYSTESRYIYGTKYGKISLQVSKDKTVSGYEVLYAANKNFKYAKKLVSNSYKKTKFTINNALSRRTYYIKARAFVKVGGKKIYGAYSKTDTYRIY